MPVPHGDQRHLLFAAGQHVHAHLGWQVRHLLDEPMPASDLERGKAYVPQRAWRSKRLLDSADMQNVNFVSAECQGPADRDRVHKAAVEEVLAVDDDGRQESWYC